RCAGSLKPNVAYRAPNLLAGWKKQTILPSLAYAGIPYQVRGASSGAAEVMIAWRRSASTRSGSCISAIFSRRVARSSALVAPRLAAFASAARSFIAARSASVNPGAAVLAAAFFAGAFFAGAFFAGAFFAAVFLAAGFAGSVIAATPRTNPG